MTKTILIATASAMALTSCALPGPRFDPRNPKVFIVDNGATKCEEKKTYIVVDQEPIYFFRRGSAQAFPIIWHLQTPGYSFVQDNSIADPTPQKSSAPGEINNCRAGGRAMQCTNNSRTWGVWKYTLRITADDKCGTPPDLDPTIAND